MSREYLDVGIVYAAWLALAGALLTAATVRRLFSVTPLPWPEPAVLIATPLIVGLFAYLATANGDGAALATAFGLAITLAARAVLPRLTTAGVLTMAALPYGGVAGAAWGYTLIAEHGASAAVLDGVIVAAVIAIPLGAIAFVEKLARQGMTLQADWRRPTAPLPRHAGHPRKISIHLPCYAEPPAIVIAVLDRLARLDHPDFEVLVCDNNTADEALWRPVERHVAWLNARSGTARFRFFHVAPLAGAKAGALNWLLDRTASDAELIAVIDADYIAEPDFLARLTGYFDDPAIGYVQTPHDYRDWADSPYLTACYREYMPSNKVELPGVADVGAGYTIGTMCLIRRSMLERAGRWAEWCLTEDSEVSVRLRAIGAQGLYIADTFGRGLIPDTFDDYKKQRFRWTAGPVQQLRRHWRLYLPRLLGGSRAIGGWSKLLEVQRGVAPLVQLAGMVLGFAGAVAALALVARGALRPIDVPAAAWLAGWIALAATAVATVTRYRLAGCTSLREIALGELARLSLSYVQLVGGVAGLSRQPIAWRRTPKFAARRSGLRALGSTIPETALGFAHLILGAGIAGASGLVGADLALIGAIGAMAGALRFFAAPAMALLGERSLGQAAGAPTLVEQRAR